MTGSVSDTALRVLGNMNALTHN